MPLANWQLGNNRTNVKPEETSISCSKCGFEYLELVELKKYLDITVVFGQKPRQKRLGSGFYFLRCPRCSTMIEPRTLGGFTTKEREEYDKLLDMIENVDI